MLHQHRRLLIVILFLIGTPAAAVDFGRPLTSEEVACEERQLERLLHRMWVDREGSTLLFWRASAAGGLYRGLVSTSEIFEQNAGRTREEKQLAFDLILKSGEVFLDPHKPRRPQATLVRRDAASNLLPPAVASRTLDLALDVAPVVVDPSSPYLPIRITNRLVAGAGADDRPGWGIAIDDLLSPCHTEVSEFDLRVFAILARTVRPSQCLAEPFSTCDAALERFKTVFLRDTEPLTYRMNIYPYVFTGLTDARVAIRFRLQVDERGWLTGGEVKALPWCVGGDHGGCTFFFNPTIALFVLPPLRPGIERQGEAEFRRAAHLNIIYEGSLDNVLEDTVNWADLLRDTAWNVGLVP